MEACNASLFYSLAASVLVETTMYTDPDCGSISVQNLLKSLPQKYINIHQYILRCSPIPECGMLPTCTCHFTGLGHVHILPLARARDQFGVMVSNFHVATSRGKHRRFGHKQQLQLCKHERETCPKLFWRNVTDVFRPYLIGSACSSCASSSQRGQWQWNPQCLCKCSRRCIRACVRNGVSHPP